MMVNTRIACISIVIQAAVAFLSHGAQIWQEVSPLPDARFNHAAATGLNGLIYSIAGDDLTSADRTSDVFAYDPDANTWSLVTPLPTDRGVFGAATGVDGRIYAIGGDTTTNFVNLNEAYDPVANTWSPAPPLPTGRNGLSVVAGPDGLIYAIGGQGQSGYSTAVEAFDPIADAWTTRAPIPTGRRYSGATVGADGRIYVLGGETNSGAVAMADVYDPITDNWSSIAPLPSARQFLTAALSPTGQVLAIGGHGTEGEVLAYDAIANEWSPFPSLNTVVSQHATAVGLDGVVYAIGGFDMSETNIPTVEALGLPESMTSGLLGHTFRLTHEVDDMDTNEVMVIGGPFDFAAGPGVDVTNVCCGNDAYEVDVKETQIRIDFNLLPNGHWSNNANFNGPHFFDITGTIPRFSDITLSETNFDVGAIGVEFDDDNIRVDFIASGQDLFFNDTHYIVLDVLLDGAINNWAGPVDSVANWSVNSSWSLARVPAPSDAAVIDGLHPQLGNVSIESPISVQSLSVGQSSVGRLTIDPNGSVASETGGIGKLTGSVGWVTLNGSTWNNSEDLSIGVSGTGTLNIDVGGLVTNTHGIIGHNSDAIGLVNVAGSGSAWINSTELTVGNFGSGALNIVDGGSVSNASGYIGREEDSTGVVVVTGTGSTWTNSDNFYVGYAGDGTLSIEAGGSVSNTSGRVGYLPAGTGTAKVSGAGSLWTNSGSIIVGDFFGDGSLNVEQGGVVSADLVIIGNTSFGHISGKAGRATVAGPGSSLVSNTDLFVGGADGIGTLTVQNGAEISNQEIGYVGWQRNSEGIVLVEGDGSQWTVGESLLIGDRGNGSLEIRNGGAVSAGDTVSVNTQSRISLDGGTLMAPTTQLSGTLAGMGNVIGNLTNRGTITPGFSPGIIEIDGDYTQESAGILEIEIGGLTPGDEHDQVQVSGMASLGGRLEVPLIDGFIPAMDDEVTFLTADGGVSGQFGSIVSPNLASEAPDLALQVNYGQNDIRLRFVGPSTGIQFETTESATEWSNAGTWTNDAVPNTTNVIDMTNLAGAPQRVNVANQNAFTHQLLIAGDVANTITVGVQNGNTLSATTNVTVGSSGIVELDDGIVASANVEIQAGGMLAGNGTVVADLRVGTTTTQQPAVINPGLSVGHLDIVGDYAQGSGGVLAMEIEGGEPGQFDTVDVSSGAVELGGTLRIDVSQLSSVAAHDSYTLITADAGTGSFDRVEVIDPEGVTDGLYFSPFYGSSLLGAVQPRGVELASRYESGGRWLNMGDVDGDNMIDENDAKVLAAVLIDDTLQGYTIDESRHAAANFVTGFDFYTDGVPDGIQLIDFDDVAGFVEAMSQSQGMTLQAAQSVFDVAYAQTIRQLQVPEPHSIALLAGAVAILGIVCRLSRQRDYQRLACCTRRAIR